MERSRKSRGTFDAGSCAFTIINTTKNEYIKFNGIFERKKLNDNIQRPCKFKIQIRNCNFWATGYYVSTVGLNEATIRKYIRDQEKEDVLEDKLTKKESHNHFKGLLQ